MILAVLATCLAAGGALAGRLRPGPGGMLGGLEFPLATGLLGGDVGTRI